MTCTPSRVLNLIERMINTVSAVNSQESMVLTLLPAKIWGSDGNGVENLPHQIKCGFPSSRSYEEHHSGSPTWISGVDNLAWRRRDVKWKADQAYQMATVPPKKKKNFTQNYGTDISFLFPFCWTDRKGESKAISARGRPAGFDLLCVCVVCILLSTSLFLVYASRLFESFQNPTDLPK